MQAQIISNYILRVGPFTMNHFLFSSQLILGRPPRPQEDTHQGEHFMSQESSYLSEIVYKGGEQEICRLLLTMALQNSLKECVKSGNYLPNTAGLPSVG